MIEFTIEFYSFHNYNSFVSQLLFIRFIIEKRINNN